MTQGLRNLLDLPLMEDMLRQAGVLANTTRIDPACLSDEPPRDPGRDNPPDDGRDHSPHDPGRDNWPHEPDCDNPPDNSRSQSVDPDLLHRIALADQAQARLTMVEGSDHAEAMDRLFKETLKHAQDLMDLGFNIDIPRARGIFEVAANMYGRSIEAKNAKRDAQLKAMRLALEQRKLDLYEQKLNAQAGTLPATSFQPDPTVVKEDRNDLIKRLRAQRDQG